MSAYHSQCPQWCDPLCHREHDNGDVDHRSESTRLGFADFTMATSLTRPDCPEPSEAELYVEITVPDQQASFVTGPDGVVCVEVRFAMFLDEVEAVERHQTEQRFRAQFHGAPVVRGRVA